MLKKVWRGESFPADRDEYISVENRLAREKYSWRGNDDASWEDLSVQERTNRVKEKLKEYCRMVSLLLQSDLQQRNKDGSVFGVHMILSLLHSFKDFYPVCLG